MCVVNANEEDARVDGRHSAPLPRVACPVRVFYASNAPLPVHYLRVLRAQGTETIKTSRCSSQKVPFFPVLHALFVVLALPLHYLRVLRAQGTETIETSRCSSQKVPRFPVLHALFVVLAPLFDLIVESFCLFTSALSGAESWKPQLKPVLVNIYEWNRTCTAVYSS
ncbi:unnamed protein product [Cylicocyclus nassatus]|uniref:Uncharacterized protein n=1 Tax=Cylicocyclus nassatus TaxID=53992 RepID=A0AA36DK65_CYLNA|nr:unnamed protein product [Cylicocyclus nassatus]